MAQHRQESALTVQWFRRCEDCGKGWVLYREEPFEGYGPPKKASVFGPILGFARLGPLRRVLGREKAAQVLRDATYPRNTGGKASSDG